MNQDATDQDATSLQLRSTLEDALEEASRSLQSLAKVKEIPDRRYLISDDIDIDDMFYEWRGVGAETIVRIDDSGWIAEALRRTPKDELSDEDVKSLTDQLVNVKKSIATIDSSLFLGRSKEERIQFEKEFGEQHSALSREAKKWTRKEMLEEIEIEGEVARKARTQERITLYQDQLVQALKNARSRASDTIDQAEEKIKTRIDQVFPTPFLVEAKNARRRGYVWCVMCLFLLGATAWIMVDLLAEIDLQSKYVWQTVAAVTAGRLAVTGILGYGVVWTARMTRASMHEAAMNEQKAVSLATLETFLRYGSEGDSGGRANEQMARGAAAAIFEVGESGYVKGAGRGSRAEGALLQGLRGMIKEMKEKED